MARNVASAVVVNPGGAIVIDASHGGIDSGGVNESMVRDFIQKDLAKYPELRAKAAAIQDIVIQSDGNVSSADYAQDMMQRYVQNMNGKGWARPEGLHIFETFLGSVVVYVAYGI